MSSSLLVVDGDLGCVATFAVLVSQSWHVDGFPTGRQALNRLEGVRPDLVVFSAHLPDLDGVCLIRAVHARYPDCPALVMTDTDTTPDLLRALAGEGISAFVDKQAFWTVLEPGKAVLPRVGDTGRRGFSRDVARTVDYVRRNYAGHCVLTDMAHDLGMSWSGLAHRFRAETGMTVREYVTRVRLEITKLLLRDTDDKLHVIADRAGFYDAPHLCRTFLRHELCRPTEWRTKLRRDAARLGTH
jgi:AraC-like DNA-binding protein/CheY-like chemotaxis protein